MKLDEFHYHELIHTISIIRDTVEHQLRNHHAGRYYHKDIDDIQSKLGDLMSKVCNNSDKKFPPKFFSERK